MFPNVVDPDPMEGTRSRRSRWIAVSLFVFVAACATDRHHRVRAAEFLEAAALPTGSALSSRLIGVTDDRVFLRVWSAMTSTLGGGDHVYSVGIDELPADAAARLRAGEDPWAGSGCTEPVPAAGDTARR